jgi:hypothetical protein
MVSRAQAPLGYLLGSMTLFSDLVGEWSANLLMSAWLTVDNDRDER